MREYMRAYYAKNAAHLCEYQRKRYAQATKRSTPTQFAEARIERGYSQIALAKMVGTSQATISRIERCAAALEGFGKKDKLCALLGVEA